MNDNIGIYIIEDGRLAEYRDGIFAAEPGEITVYEVIRIIKGIPLFYEDHYERLELSLKAYSLKPPVSMDRLKKEIGELLKAESRTDCNVKILVRNTGNGIRYTVYVVKFSYPDKDDYLKGVPADIMHWERSDPNIKYLNSYYASKAADLKREKGVYELLLVNGKGQITEGSKSNVFFVMGDKVVTPSDKFVLKGVTRRHTLDICKSLDIKVEEDLVSIDSLRETDAVFLTGTSINVLPVCRIGDIHFDSANNTLVKRIREKFEFLIRQYLEQHGVN